jgi:hypothetical protein
MSVNVAAGKAFIDGTENANQGAYLAVNDATVNLAISASSPTNPRKDLIVAKVQDAEWSGATNSWSLAVVTGTPAASPAEPAVPANAVVLALVDIAANATSITNANITDRRRRAFTLGGIVVCTSTTRPTTPYEGQIIYETDTDKVYSYDGTNWAPPKNVHGGTLGYAAASGNTAVSGAGPTDIAGCSVAVTVPANRRVKVKGFAGVGSTVATDCIRMKLMEGAAVLNLGDIVPGVAQGSSGNLALNVEAILTPSAGAHTYKMVGERVVGSGTVTFSSNPAFPYLTYIEVEDIGGV